MCTGVVGSAPLVTAGYGDADPSPEHSQRRVGKSTAEWRWAWARQWAPSVGSFGPARTQRGRHVAPRGVAVSYSSRTFARLWLIKGNYYN